MSVNCFLFFTLLISIFVLVYFFYPTIKSILQVRRLKIIKETAALKKDLEFLELDKTKVYSKYLIAKDEVDDWMSDAELSYGSVYETNKKNFTMYVNVLKNRKFYRLKMLELEKKVDICDLVFKKIKKELKKSFSSDVDFSQMIKKI